MGITVPVLRYLGQIWWKIPGSWKQKKQILSCIAPPVRDYAERNPHGGYDAIVTRFGTPEQIAETYLADMELEELSKHLKIRKKIITILVASALSIVILWGVAVLHILHEYGDVTPGYIEVTVEVEERIPAEGG